MLSSSVPDVCGDELGDRKAQHIAAAQPDAVATGNPACQLQLRAALDRKGEKTPVLYTIQILDASIRNSGVSMK